MENPDIEGAVTRWSDMCDGIQGKPSEVSVLNEKGETKSNAQSLWSWRWFGPGLLVCLADTDYGCLVVAGQDGAKWGYSLLPLQVVLVPVLFMAQELTVRLGIHTRKGHTACIRDHFGSFWAWTSCAVLVLECIGAIISQMTGVAAVVELWGGTQAVGVVLSSCTIVAVVVCCSYKQIETIGVVLGLFELVFVFTMFWMHPPPREVFTGMAKQHHESEYLKLFTANIGAVIMPWMIYFQQSAVVARRLTTGADMKEERTQTLVGSILTQLVMIATLVTLAASEVNGSLKSANDFVRALQPTFGVTLSKVLLSLAFLGGSMCAAFVVSLAAAWAVCEAAGWDESFSLDHSVTEAPRFYLCFLGVVAVGASVLMHGIDDIKLNIFIELMDGLLMPMAVGFLYLLATSDILPPGVRVSGVYKVVAAAVFGICALVSLSFGIYGLVAKMW